MASTTSFQLSSSSVLRGIGSLLDLSGAPMRLLTNRTPTSASKRAMRADVLTVADDARAAIAQLAPNVEAHDG